MLPVIGSNLVADSAVAVVTVLPAAIQPFKSVPREPGSPPGCGKSDLPRLLLDSASPPTPSALEVPKAGPLTTANNQRKVAWYTARCTTAMSNTVLQRLRMPSVLLQVVASIYESLAVTAENIGSPSHLGTTESGPRSHVVDTYQIRTSEQLRLPHLGLGGESARSRSPATGRFRMAPDPNTIAKATKRTRSPVARLRAHPTRVLS